MKFLRRHPFLGLEFDWLGIDENNHLGYFSTAGSGPIPESLSNNSNDVDIYSEVVSLPLTSSEIEFNRLSYDIQNWLEIAKRGFFSFDWSFEHKAYRRIAGPVIPLEFQDLSNKLLRELAEGNTFSELFADTEFLRYW